MMIRDEYCHVCEKITRHTGIGSKHCNVCAEREDRMRIAKWNAQTTDEKLQDLRLRVEKLEQGPARY